MNTLTQEQIDIQKENLFMYKVKHDRIWYMENFLKIRDKKTKLVPFKANNAQRIFNSIIEKTEAEHKLHRYIILKARQLGISTFVEGAIFHDTSTDDYINSMIIAHEDKATQNLFNMSKLFYDELPEGLKPMKKYSNEKALSFENPTNNDQEKADAVQPAAIATWIAEHFDDPDIPAEKFFDSKVVV